MTGGKKCKDDLMTVRRITSDFVDRVGGDGFHDIKRSKTIIGKIIWIILFLAAWTLVCYQVVTYVKKYFTYPIDTSVELKFDSAAVFPAVTFCNLNPVKADEVYGNSEFAEDLREMMVQKPPTDQKAKIAKMSWTAEREVFGPPGSMPGSDDASDVNDYAYWIESDDGEHEFWSPDQEPEELQQAGYFYYEYFMMEDAKKKTIGHQIDDMLIECIWKEKQCFPENFTHTLHPLYGNCYTFNAGWSWTDAAQTQRKTSSPQKISMPGPSDGLSVVFHVEADDYLPLLADSTGVRVHVHPQEAVPHPEDTGFTVSAGFYSALEIRKVEIDRLPLPYNNEDCGTASYKYADKVKDFWISSEYAMGTCMKMCYQEKLEEKCGCVDAETFFLGDPATSRPCNSTSGKDGFCMKSFDTQFRLGNYSSYCTGQCVQACTEVDYEVQASSAQWPNDVYMELLKDTVMSRNDYLKEKLEGGGDNDDVRANLLKVDLYYQSLNYKIIQEQEAYVLVDMLADLGGAVDLWVGMSVLAMVQCIEFIIQLFFYLCCRKPHQNSNKAIKSNQIYDKAPKKPLPPKA